MTSPATYPRRPPFFANRFCRLMTKVALANQIGSEACFLLMTVAMTEDAKSYRGPVTYWNEQLMPLVGANNVKSLIRVRSKAVESGWLHYEAGGKGVPGRYWVNVPAEYDAMDDLPVDENPAEYRSVLTVKNDTRSAVEGSFRAASGARNDTVSAVEVGTEAEEKCSGSGKHSSLSFPEPREEEEPPLPPQAGGVSNPQAKAKRTKKQPQHPESVSIPSSLDTPPFRATWADWLADRKARGKCVTELAARQQLEDLAPLGPERAIECVKASIRNGWAGLFPDKYRGPTPTHGTKPPAETPMERMQRLQAELDARSGGTNG